MTAARHKPTAVKGTLSAYTQVRGEAWERTVARCSSLWGRGVACSRHKRGGWALSTDEVQLPRRGRG